MILSDASIDEYVTRFSLIEPFRRKQLQPASYDLTLGELPGGLRKLEPGQFILASTLERVNIPAHVVGRIEGKSSWARKGLIIHTAGFVDPGFRGQLTLEMTNLSDTPVPLKVGVLIAQIAFQLLDKPAARPYGHPELGSHYQNQEGITDSRG